MFQQYYRDALATLPAEITWWPGWAKCVFAVWVAVLGVLIVSATTVGMKETGTLAEAAWASFAESALIMVAGAWVTLPVALFLFLPVGALLYATHG